MTTETENAGAGADEVVSNWLVHGRAHGDDDDCCFSYENCTQSSAEASFVSELEGDPEDHSEDAMTRGKVCVYVISTWRSDAPIVSA